MRTQPRGRQNAVKISALAAKAQPPAPAHAEDDLSSFAQPAPRMLPVLHRQRRGARGTPSVGLPAAICLADEEDFVEARLWGVKNLDFLRRFLPFNDGLPSHDTLNDVINALDPALFKTCFVAWVEELRDAEPDLVAIDGKTSRRTPARRKAGEPLHLVSAWAARQRLVLGQEATDAKSNEITAIPLLLERLALTGALVALDAMGCQTKIAEAIQAKGADYLIAVKDNWPT